MGLAQQGSAAADASGLVQLFAVAGDLPPEVAVLLPEVLVVTAKQLRGEIMVDVAQNEPMILSPAPNCSPDHSAVLHSLSTAKVALLVELPQHDLVLCPEAGMTGGNALIIGVLRARQGPPAGAVAAAAAAAAAGLGGSPGGGGSAMQQAGGVKKQTGGAVQGFGVEDAVASGHT
ncbi:hypothetical protein OEZ86_005000 [Tetradesmus obliquus]|nr:hypothetical protein OEZ86_005000 [Tetradesmus obliquus]